MNYVQKVFCFLQLVQGFYGDIELSCDTINTLVPANVTCVCTFSGQGISWFYLNDTNLVTVTCLPPLPCLPMINGFVFSTNVSESLYKMKVINYSYSDCIAFTCKDMHNSSAKKSARPRPAKFDLTSQVSLNEPSSNYSSGNISITIGCVFEYWKLKTKWFIVNVDSDTEYSFDRHAPIFNADNSSCNPCDDDPLASLTIGFIHTETNESNSKKVSFKVKIYHEDYTSDFMMLNFENEYTVQGMENGEHASEKDKEINSTFIYIGVGIFVFTIGTIWTIFGVSIYYFFLKGKKQYKVKENSSQSETELFDKTDDSQNAEIEISCATTQDQSNTSVKQTSPENGETKACSSQSETSERKDDSQTPVGKDSA